MRELTKSMLSFSWAMPLYGMRQMLNMSFPRDMSRPFDQATEGFETVTDTVRDNLGSTMQGLFDTGDRIQRGLVDLMFSFIPTNALDPNAWARTGSDVMQRSAQGLGQAAAAVTPPPSGGGFGPAGQGYGAPGTAGASGQSSGQSSRQTTAGQSGWGPIPRTPG
jgi:hypothetical protein